MSICIEAKKSKKKKKKEVKQRQSVFTTDGKEQEEGNCQHKWVQRVRNVDLK